MSVRIKLSLTGGLLVLSVVLASIRGYPWQWMICAALGASWVGDAMLSRYWPVSGLVKDSFIAGMGAFWVAQVLYIIAFSLSLSGMPDLHLAYPGWAVGRDLVVVLLPIYLLAGLMFWIMIVLRSNRPGYLKAATLFYGETLYAMAGMACVASFTGVSIIWMLTIGGLLFIVSDSAIAMRIFQDKFANERRYEAFVWGTYFPAQILLLLGAFWLF